MAVIQYTGIVNQIRGKLNGSVFNKARNANTLQRKQQAPRRNVGFSAEPRNVFSVAQRSWKGLTSTQRSQWAAAATNNPSRDRFGELVALSGYNQYIKAFVLASYAGVTPPETPDINPAPALDEIAFDWSQVEFRALSTGATEIEFINFLLNYAGTSTDFHMIIDVGLPVSEGVTVYYGRYSFVHALLVADGVDITFSESLGSRYPLPANGQPIYVRFRVIYVPNGAIVFQDVRRTFAVVI